MSDDPTKRFEGLLQRLEQMVSGGRDHGANHDGHGPVPYSRFRDVIDENKALKASVQQLRADFDGVRTGFEQQLEQVRTKAGESVTALQTRHNQDLELVDAGLTDPYGRQILREAFERAPKSERGKSPVDFWQQTLQAHQAHLADPENAAAPTVPRPLTVYLPSGAVDSAENGGQKGGGRSGEPPPNGPGKRDAGSYDDLPTGSLEELFGALEKLG